MITKAARPTALILRHKNFQRRIDLEDRFESALLTTSLKKDRFLNLDGVKKRLGLRS